MVVFAEPPQRRKKFLSVTEDTRNRKGNRAPHLLKPFLDEALGVGRGDGPGEGNHLFLC